MAEARQVDRVIEELDADELAAAGQRHFVEGRPVVVRHVQLAFRRIGVGLDGLVRGADREGEARAERVRRTHQVAEVQRLRHAFGPMAK